MPYPTIYNVTYSYTGFQQAQGNNSFPGTHIDADLAGLQASVSALALFTRGVMRSDGALNNGIVTYDSLAASLQTAGLAPAAAWAALTAYSSGVSVITNNNLYRALVAHTSGVFATDLAAGKWLFVSALATGAVYSGSPTIGTELRGAGALVVPRFVNSGHICTDDFGCVGDGLTNDDAAFDACIAALVANGGGALRVRGLINLGAPRLMPSNVRVFGSNKYKDGFVLRAGVACTIGILNFNNQRNWSVENLAFFGNAVYPGAFTGGAIQVVGDFLSTFELNNWSIKGCYFVGFRATAWIDLVQSAQPTNVNSSKFWTISNNTFFSSAGDASTGGVGYPLGGAANTNGNSFIYIRGNTTTGLTDAGTFSNGLIERNRCHGLGCAGGVMIQRGNHDISVTKNVFTNMGDFSLPNDRAYVLMAYNSSSGVLQSPRNIDFEGNVIDGYRNFAIYIAGAHQCSARGNIITNGVATNVDEVGSLAWGHAIVANGATDFLCDSNQIYDSPGGIYYGQNAVYPNSTDIISNNIIRSSTAAGNGNVPPTGITIAPDAIASAADKYTTLNCTGNNINVNGTNSAGVKLLGTAQLGRIRLTNNAIKSGVNGILTVNGPLLAIELTFANNTISGALSGYAASIAAGASPVRIKNETVDFSEVLAGTTNGYNVDGCTGLTINGLELAKKTSVGAALSMIGTQGRCSSVSFPGTTTQVAATSAGLSKPAWAGSAFDTFQNFGSSFYTETGVTPKYTLDSWVWSTGTTWLDRRMSTGN